jgi:aldose 1-epimerase
MMRHMPHAIEATTVAGHTGVTLHAPEAEVAATFLPGLGMLGCSLRHRGEELLALRDGVPAYAATGSTSGIPLLYPWANRLGSDRFELLGRTVAIAGEPPLVRREEHDLVIHGLLGAHPGWRVDAEAAGEDGARLVASLDFGAHPELMERFPFPHRLDIAVELAHATLRVVTRVEATEPVAVPVSFGYHPYFALPGVPRAEWELELPSRARLVLDENMLPTGERVPEAPERAPIGDRLFDDGYDGLVPASSFGLAGGGRRLVLVLEAGYPCAQVFVPPGDEYACLEPMTAPTNAFVEHAALPLARPGAPYEATWSLTVDS